MIQSTEQNNLLIDPISFNIDEYNKNNPNYFVKVIDGELVSVRNEEKFKIITEALLRKKFEDAKIPLRYIPLELNALKIDDNIKKQIMVYCSKFKPKTFMNIYLEGANTSGKTSTACCIAKDLIRQGYSGEFIYATKLSNILQDSFSYGKIAEEAKVRLSELLKKDFIVVDDAFDIEKDVIYKSSNVRSQWDSFFREALDSGVTIIVNSNTLKSDIEQDYGVSIQNLIDRDFGIVIRFKTGLKDDIVRDKKESSKQKLRD